MENVESSRRCRIYNNPYYPKPRKALDSYIKRLGLEYNKTFLQHWQVVDSVSYSLQKKKISNRKNAKRDQWWNIKKKNYIFFYLIIIILFFLALWLQIVGKLFLYKSIQK